MIAEPNVRQLLSRPLRPPLQPGITGAPVFCERVRPHAVSRFQQAQCGSPRRLLCFGRCGQLCQYRAAGEVVPFLVGVNDVAIERGQFAEAGAVEEGGICTFLRRPWPLAQPARRRFAQASS